jgi:hypothetical protein
MVVVAVAAAYPAELLIDGIRKSFPPRCAGEFNLRKVSRQDGQFKFKFWLLSRFSFFE